MDGELPEPIEVELVAHEPRSDRSGRWRREPESADPVEPVEPAPDPDRPPLRARPYRTQPVLVAAVAAALALVLGWVIGRVTAGESDPVADGAADSVTTTTVATADPTLPIVGEEIAGADFDEPVVSTPGGTDRRESGPVTTEPGGRTAGPTRGPTTQPIAIDARLAGVPVRLVGVEPSGALVEADLADGTLTDFGVDRVVSDGRPLVVGTDWVVTSSPTGRFRVIRSDGSESTIESTIDLGDSWQVLNVPGTEQFWRVPRGRPGDTSLVLALVDLDGEPVGPELELPLNSWPMLVDPASGGLVVGAGSRNYVLTPDGVLYLGLGSIIGISPDALVTYDCDEALVCSLFRTDRATGSVTVVPSDPELDEPYQWNSTAGWGGTGVGSLSPDGRWVAVIGSSWRNSVAGIVELETGRFVELSRLSSPPAVVWSPDGRWVFALDDQAVTVFDTVTGDRFPVFTDAVQWIQLGTRPLAVESPDVGSEGATSLRIVPGD